MITITKDITITIDKGDVPVLSDICEIARQRLSAGAFPLTAETDEEHIQEIRKFLKIIFEGV